MIWRTSIGVVTFLGVCMASCPAPAADEGWSGEVSASFAAQTGTVDTVAGSGDVTLKRAWEKDEADFRFTGSYGSSKESGTVQDNQALTAGWKHTLADRFFVKSKTVLSRDSTQDRRVRFAVNTGPGYRVWRGEDESKSYLDVTAGLGYRYEVFDGGASAKTAFASYTDLVAGFEYKKALFDDRINYTQTAGLALPANAIDSYVVRSEAIVGVPLTEAWSFRTSLVVEYNNAVPAGINKMQTNTTVGLGYKF